MAEEKVEKQEQSAVKLRSGNTRIPFGLCKRYGIDLPDDATPRDAWNALEGKGITRKQVYDALKRSGTVKNVKTEPKKMTEEQFLAKKGLYGMSDVGLDTSRIPNGETQRQRDKRIKEENEKATKFYEEKQKAREEYNAKVESGEIQKLSTVDRLIEEAKGHEDNEQTKAAIRSLEKRALKDTQIINELYRYALPGDPREADEEKKQQYYNALREKQKIQSALREINGKTASTDKYKASHDEIIDFVKKQVGIDLNKYRDGNGDDPYTTAYWDKNGYKVAINRKALTKEDQNRLNELVSKGKIKQEQGGAWFDYISFGESKEKNDKKWTPVTPFDERFSQIEQFYRKSIAHTGNMSTTPQKSYIALKNMIDNINKQIDFGEINDEYKPRAKAVIYKAQKLMKEIETAEASHLPLTKDLKKD